MPSFTDIPKYLEENGHYKGAYRNPDGTGSVCALGAMIELGMYEHLSDWIEYRDHLGAIIMELYPDRLSAWTGGTERVSSFNDHPDTTIDDIRAVCEKAQIRWDERV